MRLIDKVARITILLALVGCARSHTAQHDNQVFYGSAGFGYQWNNPSPYGDWFPVATDVYEFGLKGPHGQIQVNFLSTNLIDSFDSAILSVLGSTDYDVIKEEIYSNDGREVHWRRLLISTDINESYIQVALFRFNDEHWALIQGVPEIGHEENLDSAFSTILWSLEPYKLEDSSSLER